MRSKNNIVTSAYFGRKIGDYAVIQDA